MQLTMEQIIMSALAQDEGLRVMMDEWQAQLDGSQQDAA